MADYVRRLKHYSREHDLNGEPDLQEDYNPDTGNVLVGLRPRADNILEINPLIPADPNSTNTLDYFCLENVPYHGQLVTILYDRDGKHYKKGAGLFLCM